MRTVLSDPPMTNQRDQRVITPMPDELVKAIDDYRFEHRMLSRAAAIRRLIEMGLEAAKTAENE